MRKIFNVLMVMCLAVAALSLSFAIFLPDVRTSGASVSATSATPSAVNGQTAAEFDSVRPAFVGVNYFTSEGDFNRGLTANRQPVIVNQFSVKQKNFVPPNYNLPIKRSLFDTPLFANSKSLRHPPMFSQPLKR